MHTNIVARWPGATHSFFLLTNSSVVRATRQIYTNLHIKWGRSWGGESGSSMCAQFHANLRCTKDLLESVLTQGWYIWIDLCIGFVRPQGFNKKSTQVFVHEAPAPEHSAVSTREHSTSSTSSHIILLCKTDFIRVFLMSFPGFSVFVLLVSVV